MHHRVHRLLIGAALIGSSVLTFGQVAEASDSAPAPFTDNANFCIDVQNSLARTKPEAVNFVGFHYDEDDLTSPGSGFGFRGFRTTYNKEAATNDLAVHQMNIDAADGSVSQVMCKTKLRERLVTFTDPVLTKAFRGHENDCSEPLKRIRNEAKSRIEAAGGSVRKHTSDAPVYDEFGGLGWLTLTPIFSTITTDADGVVHLRTHGLRTSNDPNTTISNAFVDMINAQFGAFLPAPLPYGTTYADIVALGFLNPKVLGTHYCTLPTVEAVVAALTA